MVASDAEARTVRLRVAANPDLPYTLMIEPWGMTYELVGTDRMSVDLVVPEGGDPEIVAWPGGVSIFAYGPAITRDEDGQVLHEF